MDQAKTLVRELLLAVLAGLGLATAVNLLVIPISSRMIVSGQTERMIGLLQNAMSKQRTYLCSIESDDPVRIFTHEVNRDVVTARSKKPTTKETKAADALKGNRDAILKLTGEFCKEMAFARWDIVFGKLDGNDLERILKHFRSIVVPMEVFPETLTVI
jgi:Putative ER transporter, 6TM, N-terminal